MSLLKLKRRKEIHIHLVVTVPRHRSAAWTRRNVKWLINTGVGWDTHAGEEITARRVGRIVLPP